MSQSHASPRRNAAERQPAAGRAQWIFLALLGLCCAGPCIAEHAEAVSKEYQIKAAFLYNMPKFVEWPPERFADAAAPIVIGVLGENPFGDQLAAIVKDRKINGRAVLVRSVQTLDEAKATHVLFIGERAEARLAAMWPALALLPVLTVGESATFIEAGGIIRFVPVGDKLRFEIDMSSAERAQLKISAQLQKLATGIRRNP
jgi:YfiR/HmsC-like